MMFVHQYDLAGNYIKGYYSYSEAAKTLGVNESSVRKGAKFNRTVLGKFKFSLKAPETSAPTQKLIKKVPFKILFLDIETSPLLAFVYQKQVWKARIGHKQVVSDYFMLTWSAKFLGETSIYSDRLSGEEAWNEDDERIVGSLWELIDEADIIVAHNGNSFDIPNINTRFVYWGLVPPSPYRQIDTLKIAQTNFGFTHNGLDALAEFFGIEGKIETNFELWKRCVRGIEDALIEMEVYNRKDVTVLEEVFHKIKGYAKGLPNLDLYNESAEPVCPTCGGDSLKPIEGKYFYTQAVRYATFQCTECGAISRSKAGVKFENKRLISAIPR